MHYSILLLIVIGAIAGFFSYVYKFFTIDLYNIILRILIIAAILVMIFVAIAAAAIFTAVKKRRVNAFLMFFIRPGLKFVMPFALFITDLLKRDKDILRGLFVEISNLLVSSARIKKRPDRIMVLLPQCIQNSECTHKVTGKISNCRKCGRCVIGRILDLVEEKGVKAYVVTGGTAARSIVAREKPGMVLSVACERDLVAGITDVSHIPVLGVVNKRPEGPCFNTTVDVELLRKKLDSIIETGY